MYICIRIQLHSPTMSMYVCMYVCMYQVCAAGVGGPDPGGYSERHRAALRGVDLPQRLYIHGGGGRQQHLPHHRTLSGHSLLLEVLCSR